MTSIMLSQRIFTVQFSLSLVHKQTDIIEIMKTLKEFTMQKEEIVDRKIQVV